MIFIISGIILEMEEPDKAVKPILLYATTAILGIFIHGLVVLPLFYWMLTRKNPYRFMLNMGNVLIMAFSTASSLATLPLNLEVTERKNLIDYRIARFVLPLGATINMDGVALYEAVAAIFVSQVNNRSLDFVSYIVICITATVSSMGAAGIPQAGMVTTAIVFNAVGLPLSELAWIIPLDWLVDRFRTTVNVLGDAFGAAIVHHITKKGLEEMDAKMILEVERDTKSGETISEQRPRH